MSRTRRGMSAALAALALTLALPAIAAAATKPGVTHRGASKVTITTATLNGKVNPHGAPTTYFFQYGTTMAYGSRTPDAGAGSRHGDRSGPPPRSPGSGRTRSTTTASSPTTPGTTAGGDRTFTTPKQPLGLALAATPNPVAFGAPSTLAGTLSGTGNAGPPDPACSRSRSRSRRAFANLGNVQLTNAQGAFAFALLSVPLTTQYRVLVTDKPSIVSPILTVNVCVVVGTKTTQHARAPRRPRALLRHAAPGRGQHPDRHPEAQRQEPLGDDLGSITRTGGVYGKTVRIRRGGSYRVYAGASGGTFAPGAGRKVRIHTS